MTYKTFYQMFVNRIGFEPMTCCLEGSCSIQLSYRSILIQRSKGKSQKWNVKMKFTIDHSPLPLERGCKIREKKVWNQAGAE